jgi:hypothetical protein
MPIFKLERPPVDKAIATKQGFGPLLAALAAAAGGFLILLILLAHYRTSIRSYQPISSEFLTEPPYNNIGAESPTSGCFLDRINDKPVGDTFDLPRNSEVTLVGWAADLVLSKVSRGGRVQIYWKRHHVLRDGEQIRTARRRIGLQKGQLGQKRVRSCCGDRAGGPGFVFGLCD